MTNEFAKRLIDLYLDDHLDVDLATEFREAMRTDPAIAEEVDSLRKMRTALMAAYARDTMTNDENRRVYGRIMRNADPAGIATYNPAGQLEIPWSEPKPNDHRL
jgi:anti-sigma factor RsiW